MTYTEMDELLVSAATDAAEKGIMYLRGRATECETHIHTWQRRRPLNAAELRNKE